jgi:Uma2 family endonuclease
MTQATTAAEPLQPRRMTYEEFLADDSIERAEWVDGEVCEMPGVDEAHARITVFLIRLIGSFVEFHDLGRIFHDPFLIKLPNSGRAPDVAFVSTANLHRLRQKDLEGPVDVAIEVISAGSRGRDRGDKYFEYEAAGVSEYWLIDPQRLVAEFYRLGAGGHFQLVDAGDGIFRSEALPGFWLNVAWLWSPTKVKDAERALGIA